jgi:hypothetical protein
MLVVDSIQSIAAARCVFAAALAAFAGAGSSPRLFLAVLNESIQHVERVSGKYSLKFVVKIFLS